LSDGDPKKEEPPEQKGARGEDDGMTIWEHLEELRSRLIKMIIAFLIGGIAAWSKKEDLLKILSRPFVHAWNEGSHSGAAALNFPAPAALFLAYIRLSALAGFVFALPFMLWQVWSFIAPGLYSKEKRYAIPFVLTSCLLFAGGGYFGWRVAFPLAFRFLLGMGTQLGELEVKPTIMISEYIDFVTRMGLAFGLAAELPVLVFFLSIAGIVTPRQLLKFFRYFLVLDFVIAAVITPPDVMSQLLLAIPLALLYLLSIGVAVIFAKKRPPPDANVDAGA
jgi:sec-independent protein translocase protein TatC